MRRRGWLTGIGAAALAGLAVIAVADRNEEPITARAPTERPTLALLTSLPLVFGESFGLDTGGSPALARLEQRYNVQPIGVADAASLKGHKLLLMAHPRAQPAEALVEVDQWVRDGGRLLLLADPKLDWPSERPLGDPLRPPPGFADTGLLAHWGLRFEGPKLVSQDCAIGDDGLIAHCRIGKGRATVIADADFLNVGPGENKQLDLLVDELDRLETR